MVLDTSALMAILQDEPERGLFIDTIRLSDTRLVSAATAVEASIVVLARRGEAGLTLFRELLSALHIEIVSLQTAHVVLAVEAFRLYGKGRHAAALNLGDCFVYALAKATGEPLLFKGDDFARTDVSRAL